ncbi:MAG: hypothetical protein L3K09_06000 [Thermoplasmata archaeon]|nr:hypothetical protein [Thermoplasmata archaeon]
MASWDQPKDRVGRLDERVVELLTARPGRFAFNGLKRALDAHPESLARALKRLEQGGLVRREDGGYRLREAPAAPRELERPEHLELVGSVRLPAGANREAVFGSVAGRWFGDSLRWAGLYEPKGGPWLVWSLAGSAGHILLQIDRGELKVWAERTPDREEAARLADAARELLFHTLERARPVATSPTSEGHALRLEAHDFVPHAG